MSDKQYETVRGVVQFDPREREVNGKKVIDIAVRDRGSDGASKLINITIWPEFLLKEPVKKGDGIMADGSVELRTFQGKDGGTQQSIQLSPYSLVHIPQVPRAERETVQAGEPASNVAQNSVPF